MASTQGANRIALDNILYLTDFSPASEAAMPLMTAIARNHDSEVFVLHVLLPDPFVCMAPECGDLIKDGQEQAAETNMQHLESHLAGLTHQTLMVHGPEVWTAIQPVMQKNDIDLLVLGTHGRTGIQRLLLGSVTEEIWRRAKVPVLTVGPANRNAKFVGRLNCVVFATDFTPESLAGYPYALSIARENHTRLILLNVIRQFKKEEILGEVSATEATHQLTKMLPPDAELGCLTELMVKHGDPAERIIEVATESGADLIVLGIRKGDNFGLATHAERTTAHDVVVNAPCPVLTIRG